jgi:hypothetical protein
VRFSEPPTGRGGSVASQRQYDVALSRLGWSVLAAKRRWAPGLPVREMWIVSLANGVMPQSREPFRSSTMPAPGNPKLT